MLARYFLQKSGEKGKYGVSEGKRNLGTIMLKKHAPLKFNPNPNSKTHINPFITVPSTNQTVGQESQLHHNNERFRDPWLLCRNPFSFFFFCSAPSLPHQTLSSKARSFLFFLEHFMRPPSPPLSQRRFQAC